LSQCWCAGPSHIVWCRFVSCRVEHLPRADNFWPFGDGVPVNARSHGPWSTGVSGRKSLSVSHHLDPASLIIPRIPREPGVGCDEGSVIVLWCAVGCRLLVCCGVVLARCGAVRCCVVRVAGYGCGVVWCGVLLVLCCVVACRIVSCRIVSCCVLSCCVVLCCVVLCCFSCVAFWCYGVAQGGICLADWS